MPFCPPIVAQLVKNPPAVRETWVPSLGWEDPLEKGKATPLQYSGLENSMDCRVHGVTKSQTRLSDLHFHFVFLKCLHTQPPQAQLHTHSGPCPPALPVVTLLSGLLCVCSIPLLTVSSFLHSMLCPASNQTVILRLLATSHRALMYQALWKGLLVHYLI